MRDNWPTISPATHAARADWENAEVNLAAGLDRPRWSVQVAQRLVDAFTADVQRWASDRDLVRS